MAESVPTLSSLVGKAAIAQAAIAQAAIAQAARAEITETAVPRKDSGSEAQVAERGQQW